MVKIMAQLRVTFLQELPERVENLESMILALKGSNDVTLIYEDLLRNVHSLKGSGGTYGYPVITTICHQMEDMLKEVSDNNLSFDRESTDKLLRYIDLLSQIPACNESGDTGLTTIESDLHKLQDSVKTGCHRCLVVEGSVTTVKMVSVILSQSKVEISHATNGYEALERLLQEKFDLLITGMAIGSLNGKALIAATRLSDSINANIPTILLTASDMSADTSLVPADIVINKGPDMPQALLEAYRKLL